MRRNILLVCTLFLSVTLSAQWEWVKVFPKKHVWIDARIDAQENFYILSNDNWPYNQGSFIIYKLDNQANLLGQKIFPKNLRLTGIEMRSDNKLFLCGYFTDTLNIDQYNVISRGKEDGILIEIDNTLQTKNVRVFAGKLDDRLTGLSCDKHNRILVVGSVCDTGKIHTQTLVCNKTGNSFLARFSSILDLQYVWKDSTHENTLYDHGFSFSSVHINNNNDILITGFGQGKDYYSFRGTQINIAPDYYYHYYRDFALHLDSNLNTRWAKVDQWGKYSGFTYDGFTTSNVSQFYSYGPGPGGSEISLLNGMGTEKKLNISPWGGKYGMGTINDRFYFHRTYEVLDTTVHDYVQRNELFAVVDTQAVLIDTVAGGIGSCRLLQGSSGDAYFVGIFIGPVAFGSHTISTGVDDHKIFIAKLGQSFNVGLKENYRSDASIKVWPNPSEGRLWISENVSAKARVFLLSLKGQKIECKIQSNEIILPEMSAGMYMIVIESGNLRVTKKVLIR